MRVTTKGQVTIPIDVREKLGIFPGTEVEFVVRGEYARLVKGRPKNGRLTRGDEIVAHLTGRATDKRLTTDQIMAMTRGED